MIPAPETKSRNLRALVIIVLSIPLWGYLQPDESGLWPALVQRYEAGPAHLIAYVGAGAVAVNLVALGLFLALLGTRKVSLGKERTRAGLRTKMVGANVLGVGVFLAALADGTPPVWSALAGGLFLLFVGVGIAIVRKGWKYDAPPAAHVLHDDPRPPVVYIRSFKDDASLLADRAQKWMGFWLPTNFEQDLASIMNRVGPFVAVGRPGEPLPEVGAARFYFSDDEWRPRVAELMEKARLVVIRSGTTANLWWEIEQAVTHLSPTRLVLIVNGKPGETNAFEARLAERIGWPGSIPNIHQRSVPGIDQGRSLLARILWLGAGPRRYAKVIYFGHDWNPRVEVMRPTLRLQYLLRMHKPFALPLEMAFDNVLQELGVPLWRPGPSRLKAAAIAVAFGILGAHHFYLGNKRKGIYCLAFCWTFVPLFLAWFDASKLLLMDEEQFRQLTK